jgi:sulfhydrogenase subunit beta (sulfur reductase)
MAYIIKKEAVLPLLRKLKKSYGLMAPVKTSFGDITFGSINEVEEVALDAGQPAISAKNAFFPQDEPMFTFSSTDHNSIKEVTDPGLTVYFGVTACDLKAITLVDKFFSDFDLPDLYYLNKRNNAILVTISCNKPEEACFCTSTNSGPVAADGFDLQLTDLGNRYYVAVGSEKGQDLINKFSMYYTPAAAADQEELYNHIAEITAKLGSKIDMGKASKAVKEIDKSFWEDLSELCLTCGGCSYVCPTCTCYNVVDRMNPKTSEGTRNRTWDSCVFEGFTRMAGRHNMINSKAERVKRRFTHKLAYHKERYGEIACVGCGRCTVTCLGGINMAKVVNEINKGGGEDE